MLHKSAIRFETEGKYGNMIKKADRDLEPHTHTQIKTVSPVRDLEFYERLIEAAATQQTAQRARLRVLARAQLAPTINAYKVVIARCR